MPWYQMIDLYHWFIDMLGNAMKSYNTIEIHWFIDSCMYMFGNASKIKQYNRNSSIYPYVLLICDCL